MTKGIHRRFDIDPDVRFDSYAERQKLYLDQSTGWLIPDTLVLQGGELQMQVNDLGCKGPPLDPQKPVVAFFGDSATMGHAFTTDSWPRHIGLQTHQPLNAAIEGANMAHMVERRRKLLEEITPDVTVAYLGWHNLIYGERGEDYWTSQLEQLLGSRVTAFCTIVGCLHEDFRTRGFGPLLNRDALTSTVGSADDAKALNEDYFNFWMDMDPTPEAIGEVLDQIAAYNDFVRRFCEKTGAVLIDLHRTFTPETYEDAPKDFFDVCHLRPRAYPKVGGFVGDVLRTALAEPGEKKTWQSRVGGLFAAKPETPEREDLKKNVYPLW